MKLTEFIKPELVWVAEQADSRDQLLNDISQRVHQQYPDINPEQLYQALLDRESKGATAVPEGIAFPHALVDNAPECFIAAVVVKSGLDFKSDRCDKVNVVFVLVGNAQSGWQHVRLLARLARICHTPGAVARITATNDPQELLESLIEEDNRHV